MAWVGSLLLLFLLLAALLWALGQILHSWLYIDVPPDLYWRAPAAAALVCLLGLVVPAIYDQATGGRWPRSLDDFILLRNVRQETLRFKEFIAEVPERGEVRFYPVPLPRGGTDWRDARAGGRPLPNNVTAITGIVDDPAETRITFRKTTNGSVLWVDDAGGRVMSQEELGTISNTSWGAFAFLAFAVIWGWLVWFVALWGFLRLVPVHAGIVAVPMFLLWAFAVGVMG